MTRDTSDPRLWNQVRDDLQRGGFLESLRRDLRELKHELLTDGQRDRLEGMGSLGRFFVLCWWLFKAALLNMSAVRRLLVVVGTVLVLASDSGGNNRGVHIVGGVAILVVLTLELKDRLLLRKELEGGHAVQRAMAPPVAPVVSGWDIWLFTRSANEVGGDVLDFLSLGESRYGIVLGDVAGKGLSAALLGVRLQATLQVFARESSGVGDVAERLNSLFCRDCPPSYFASLVYLELSAVSGHVRMVNAGHLPPMLVHSDGIEMLPRGGAALGLLKDAQYQQQEFSVGKGELLMLISDGVTEAENNAGDQYGEGRLRQYLSGTQANRASDVGEGLVRTLDQHIGDARQKDDITIAVLKKIS